MYSNIDSETSDSSFWSPPGLVRQLFAELKPWHLNAIAATLVIAFIAHQLVTMFRRRPTRQSKNVQELMQLEQERQAKKPLCESVKKEFVDKQVRA